MRGETLITKEVINSILGISESYELPERMMSVLFDDSERERMFDMFMEHSNDLTHDWFTSYFEEEHSNKTKMAQDFTPSAVCDILGNVVEPGNSIADLCAGTGGLTISAWTKIMTQCSTVMNSQEEQCRFLSSIFLSET